MKKIIKKSISVIDRKIIDIVITSKLLSNFYYLFKPSFWREQRAVLFGRYVYNKNLNNIFYLRRSIHRIEKGLLMRPRRDVFAESYIEKTVEAFISVKESRESINTLRWANDVLSKYFSVVNSNKSSIVNNSKKKFVVEEISGENNDRMIPYHRNHINKPNISIEEFEKLAIYRRSVRWFIDKKVNRELIDQAVKIAGYSPSACNRIPYKFRIFDQKDMVKDIANSAMGTTGYIDNIPTIIAVVGDLSAYPNERDRHLIYIDSSLAAMSFVYALELQSVSSCIINWPDIEKREKRIDKLLKLKPYERVTMLIAIGYEDTDGMVAYSSKKEIDEIRSYNS